MQAYRFIKTNSPDNIQLSEALFCQFSQSTEYLILIFTMNSFQDVLKVSGYSGLWLSPYRARWQAALFSYHVLRTKFSQLPNLTSNRFLWASKDTQPGNYEYSPSLPLHPGPRMPGPFRHPNSLCLSLGIEVSQFHLCALHLSFPSPTISSMGTLYSSVQCLPFDSYTFLTHSPCDSVLGNHILRNSLFCFHLHRAFTSLFFPTRHHVSFNPVQMGGPVLPHPVFQVCCWWWGVGLFSINHAPHLLMSIILPIPSSQWLSSFKA